MSPDEEALEAAARAAHQQMGAESPWPIFSQMFPEDARRIKAMLSAAITAYLSARVEQGFREMPINLTPELKQALKQRMAPADILTFEMGLIYVNEALDAHAKDSQ